MMRMTRHLTFVVAIALLLPAALQAQKRGLTVSDYYKQVVVSDVAMAPGCYLFAFTVTTVVEKENKRHREVWMLGLKNGVPEGAPFRFTDPTDDSSGPRWSPDGS